MGCRLVALSHALATLHTDGADDGARVPCAESRLAVPHARAALPGGARWWRGAVVDRRDDGPRQHRLARDARSESRRGDWRIWLRLLSGPFRGERPRPPSLGLPARG